MSFKIHLDDFSVERIAESGQCFRIVPYGADNPGVYTVTASGRVLRIRHEADGNYVFSCGRDEFDSFWRGYFDLDADYGIFKSLVLPDDEYLNNAVAFGEGIRILNQDHWEVLISFIISQRKSVPAIRTAVERLSERFGEEIEDGFFSFPTPGKLAGAGEESLAACGLGYRTGYVRAAAREVSSGRLDLGAMESMDTEALIKRLMELNGVGPKVASCAALFGYHRLDTVPVDVWMKRVIDTVYGGRLPDEYAPCAGVMQQYMFNYARLNRTGVI